jgi:hypothetical protein
VVASPIDLAQARGVNRAVCDLHRRSRAVRSHFTARRQFRRTASSTWPGLLVNPGGRSPQKAVSGGRNQAPRPALDPLVELRSTRIASNPGHPASCVQTARCAQARAPSARPGLLKSVAMRGERKVSPSELDSAYRSSGGDKRRPRCRGRNSRYSTLDLPTTTVIPIAPPASRRRPFSTTQARS